MSEAKRGNRTKQMIIVIERHREISFVE